MKERLSAAAYALLWIVALPFVAAYLLWRSIRQPAYRRHWGERFLGRSARPVAGCVWVHAVSVGETRAAAPLVAALRERHPDLHVLVTHMTPTGRETAHALYGDAVSHAYLAYDYGLALRGFLAQWKPVLGIVMETEIWPGLMRTATRTSTTMLLANGRLSERSLASALRWTSLLRPAARGFTRILAQTSGDATRFERLVGAKDGRIAITGNLKFDIDVPDAQRERASRFRELRDATRPTLLCTSTRDGEEDAIFAAWKNATASGRDARPLLVMVPRHPQRFDEVAASARARGLVVVRRSADEPVDERCDVWLGDSMGELFAYYLSSDMAYIGGSIVPLGGQNLIEAAAAGCPVLLGPHTFNFTDASNAAVACGAAVRVATYDAMVKEALALMTDDARRRAMSEAGVAFARAHRGATEATMTVVDEVLRRKTSKPRTT